VAFLAVVRHPGNWALWRQRPRVITYCLLTASVTIITTVAWWRADSPTSRDLGMLAALAGLGLLQAELSRQVERVRRRVSGSAHINMTSVWLMAGILLLPPAFAATLTAILYAHLAIRSWYRLQRVPAFRTVSNACIIMLCCYSSALTLCVLGTPDLRAATDAGWKGTSAIVAAMVTYFVVNAVLVLPARDRPGRTVLELFGGWADNALEFATLCLGTLNAIALASQPGLALLVIPPLLILHRAVLVRQLEAAAKRDAKTGAFNLVGWHSLAERVLARAERERTSFGVLMVDLDHFKSINDTFGHLNGDLVLKAVAGTIQATVRDHNDAVGRFGGEEFVVLLPDISHADIHVVAERIRKAVDDIVIELDSARLLDSLSVSIGTAMYPTAGTALQRLLDAADAALYRAKAAGRNRVVHTPTSQAS
jgi:diguanylate cyclase (GGDEF)-like protein